MSLCNYPQECACEACEPDAPGADWRSKMLRAGDEALANRQGCTCDVCESGTPIAMDEWLDQPVHRSIHSQLQAALSCGEIEVQGENDEDASCME